MNATRGSGKPANDLPLSADFSAWKCGSRTSAASRPPNWAHITDGRHCCFLCPAHGRDRLRTSFLLEKRAICGKRRFLAALLGLKRDLVAHVLAGGLLVRARRPCLR